MNARSDLARLTPEALAQLANLGLVKRAQKELAAGYVPRIEIEADGLLRAEFPDQVHTEFAPGAGLKEARCSCGAALCRHRIAVVLQHASAATEAMPETRDAPPPPVDFRTLDAAQVQARTAASLWPRVERELRQGIRIELEQCLASDRRSWIHTARLPQATVRFYAGTDLGFVRCDCSAQTRCDHIALAALALAQAGPLGDARQTLELGGEPQATRIELPIAAVRELLRCLLVEGLSEGAAEHARTAAALSQALAASRSLGATWLSLCLEAIEHWLDAYRMRSARFGLEHGLGLLAELWLRLRAAGTVGSTPSTRHVLGIGEAMETPLDRLSLLSLGLRIQSDGPERRASLAVVDTDTQTLLCLHKAWQRPVDSAHSELALLDQQRIGGSLRLARLAQGALVTTSARRRANGELKLGQSFAGKASVTAQSGDWSGLRAPLRIDSQADYLRHQTLSPPTELTARTALPGFHVLRVAKVAALGFDPSQQCLEAHLIDPSGALWIARRDYTAATPGALDAIARVLLRAQAESSPICLAGPVLRWSQGLVIEPWALSGNGLTVPDACAPDGSLAAVELVNLRTGTEDAVRAGLATLEQLLCSLLAEGLQSRSLCERAGALAGRAAQLGLTSEDPATSPTALLQQLGRQAARLQTGEREAETAALDAALGLIEFCPLARHALANLEPN